MSKSERAGVSLPDEGFVRLPQIVKPHGAVPVSRTRFYEGVATGEFPRPKKVGTASLWSVDDIREVIRRIDAGELAA